MTSEANLPTRDEMLDNAARQIDLARQALEDAAAWLRSDWQPLGTPLTGMQAARRVHLRARVSDGLRAISGWEVPE